MRIAYVCADPGVPVFGQKGCSIHVQEVIRAIRRQGAWVELFAARFDGEPPADLAEVPVYRLPEPPKGNLAAREQLCLGANAALFAALEVAGPFDSIYERYSLWSHAGMAYARASGIPGLLEVNAPLIQEQAQHRGLIDYHGATQVAQRAFGAATALLAVSQEVATYLEGWPVASGRVHVVPNGVNPERFPAVVQPARPCRPGTFTVGFVGSLKPWHGLPVLVEAFAMLHQRNADVRLLIVGDGPEQGSLRTALSGRGVLAATELAGAVAPDAAPGFLASMDVAVAPYPPQPNFYFSPLKVYEYMAAGLPVVASRIGQLAELIRDGANGLLCPPGDPVALAEALERLRRAPELRTRLGQAGRATVLQNYTWRAVAQRIFQLAGCAPALQTVTGREVA